MRYTLATLIVFFIWSCKTDPKNVVESHDPDLEAREDSLEYLQALEAQSAILYSIQADVETSAVKALSEEDAADDPAIWYDKTNPSGSIIYGTNKQGGLVSYDIYGNEIKYYELGRINNVDIFQKAKMPGTQMDLLACTNRTDQSIEIYKLENGNLSMEVNQKIMVDTTIMDDVYGICFGADMKEKIIYVFVNAKNGRLQQYKVDIVNDASIHAVLTREVAFESQTEGMVADHSRGNLYVGVEDGGIWKMKINPDDGNERTFLDQSNPENNAYIRYDLEGLTILKSGEYDLLLASSQGNFTYAIFDIKDNDRYLGSFKVSNGEKIDGVEETDGIDVVSDSINEQFNKGMLILQDGFNYNDDELAPQNFKYVDLKKVMNLPFVNK